MRPNNKRPDYRKPTHEEQLERREKLMSLRYDQGLTERQIAVRLGLSLGRISEELAVINAEFNKPLDPSIRNTFIREHEHQHRNVIGRLWQTLDETRELKDRGYVLAKISECLARREVFLARVGFFQEAPSRVEETHEETENLSEEAIERITEQFAIWQDRVRARSGKPTNDTAGGAKRKGNEDGKS
ncbi:MAG: hypothetical protein HY360_07270 [Verrucomicrobia bacterium]|nr:hypothetical protein [Verrucomicrobiota bacterium]